VNRVNWNQECRSACEDLKCDLKALFMYNIWSDLKC
jgi:hypothetical protein